jgi:hypothetical protein
MESPELRAIESKIPSLSADELLRLAGEMFQAARKLPPTPREIDWKRYVGVLTSGPDPVEFQRNVREEWD